jgi:DNA-binding MarR family transcriptional regulator
MVKNCRSEWEAALNTDRPKTGTLIRVRRESVAELLEYLSERIYSANFSGGLKPAQWAALRYLRRANSSARSITAFAKFHAVSKGAASQTMKALITKRLVEVESHHEDRRRKPLRITTKGQSKLAKDPLRHLIQVLYAFDDGRVLNLAEFLEALTRHPLMSQFGAESDMAQPATTRRSPRQGRSRKRA